MGPLIDTLPQVLTASNLSKGHGARTLFSGVTLQLTPGRRIALVGGNGVGKTTLIEILLGLQDPDEGAIHRPRDMRMGYLPQELPGVTDQTVLAEVLGGATHITALADELRRLETEMADPGQPDHEAILATYGEGQSRFEQLGGYAIEAEAHRVLAGLGFAPDDADRPVRELSGGWRMRVSLARLLLAQPDLLVLDEPTNHLDLDSIGWLSGHLEKWSGSLLFVSHDRDFIDEVANRVLELIAATTHEYVGGFAEFVVQREERMAQLEAAARQQQRQVAKTERFIERFRYKATKARQVQSRIKTLDKLERIAIPDRRQLAARFAFPEPRRSSRVIAELEQIDVGYDDTPVLRNVDLVIERGAKLAFIGPNGGGKTTLVRLLLGELSATAGRLTLGANVDRAVFVQDQTEAMDPQRSVYQEFATAITEPGSRNLRSVLGSFGFPGEAADRLVGDLSGGERTRLALGKIMAVPVNLLVLDEPTNHLDLPSCDVLEDALTAYPGTVILVSHDRHLVRSVADSLVEVRDGRVTFHDGVDEAVLTPVGATATTRIPSKNPDEGGGQHKPAHDRARQRRESASQRESKGRRDRDLRKGLARAERQWEKAEADLAAVQVELADPDIYDDHERVRHLADEHDRAEERASQCLAEWERLSDQLAR